MSGGEVEVRAFGYFWIGLQVLYVGLQATLLVTVVTILRELRAVRTRLRLLEHRYDILTAHVTGSAPPPPPNGLL